MVTQTRKINPRELAADIRAGFGGEGLMAKYHLSEIALQQLLTQLVELGGITESELEQWKNNPPTKAPKPAFLTDKSWIVPAIITACAAVALTILLLAVLWGVGPVE